MFAKFLFTSALVVLAVGYGSIAGFMQWFPYPQTTKAMVAYFDLKEHWRNDFGLTPTRQLVATRDPSRPAFRRTDEGDAPSGSFLITGTTVGKETLQGVSMFSQSGEEIHVWRIDYEELDPDGPPQTNVLLHGMAPFEDGSLIVAFDGGEALARVGACGDIRWVLDGPYHHSVTRGDDGDVWTWRGDAMVRLDAETGETLQEVGLRADLVEQTGAYGALAIRTNESANGLSYQTEAFHANDVEPLTAELAPAFPQFEVGDVVVSLRELNLVAVLDPDGPQLKWWSHGPWFRQHDPDFQPDGRITVYDNRMGLEGGSRILAVDPKTNVVETLVEDAPGAPFDSWRRGKHQVLENGHLIVTESEQGRAFEVDVEGELIWELNMIYDDERNAVITEATFVEDGFFQPGVFDCP